ncbi:DnaD domain protein [Lysinibacillus halotolerans]
MAKFRLVHTSFWNDPRVVEEMTAEDKYFFLYLLTNEFTSQIGIYQITKRQMAFDLGYSNEVINALIQRFKEHHKLIKYNDNTREIAIKNWGKYNLVRGGKPILDCVKSELKSVKDISLIPYVSISITNQTIRNVYDTYYESLTIRELHEDEATENEGEMVESSIINGSYDTYYDTSTIRGQEKEQQQEKEQEEDKEKEQQQESSLSSTPSQKLFDLFTKRLNKLPSDQLREDINYYLETYKDVDLIVEAFNRALLDGKVKAKERYANGILRNWKREGITSYKLLEEKETQEQLQFKSKPIKKEVIPDWFNKRDQPNSQSDEVIDFEAERQKILAKLEG